MLTLCLLVHLSDVQHGSIHFDLSTKMFIECRRSSQYMIKLNSLTSQDFKSENKSWIKLLCSSMESEKMYCDKSDSRGEPSTFLRHGSCKNQLVEEYFFNDTQCKRCLCRIFQRLRKRSDLKKAQFDLVAPLNSHRSTSNELFEVLYMFNFYFMSIKFPKCSFKTFRMKNHSNFVIELIHQIESTRREWKENRRKTGTENHL